MGLCALSDRHRRGLVRALDDARATVAWVASDVASVVEHAAADPPDSIVAPAARALDIVRALAGSGDPPSSTTRRRWAILAIVDDAEAEVDAAYAAVEGGAADVARAPVLRADGSLDDPDRIATRLGRLARDAHCDEAGQDSADESLLVLVGASTGGPRALARVLATRPRAPRARVVLVQHLDETFSVGLAAWLRSESGRPVEIAEEGALPTASCALLCRADAQATLDRAGRVRYRPFHDADVHRPSIDRVFQSAVRLGRAGAAALLTGMGDDGARGLLSLRDAGWRTVAQDCETSAVYGMPAAAVALGAATESLPLDLIGPALVRPAARVRA